MQNTLVTATSMQMQAEIVKYKDGRIRGLLHSIYLAAPFEFLDFVQMIDKMEEVFDEKRFPESFLTPRSSFGVTRSKTSKTKEKTQDNKLESERVDIMSDNTERIKLDDPGGPKCTFEISVKFRQNATWQGQILWAEKNVKQNFRSVLEMLKLMDNALSESAGDMQIVDWSAI